MGVCLVTGVKSHYSGLCSFDAQDVKATILAYVGLRVKLRMNFRLMYSLIFNPLNYLTCTKPMAHVNVSHFL